MQHDTSNFKDQSRCGLLSSAGGDVIFFYENDETINFDWAEYDPISSDLTFIIKDEKVQNSGLNIKDAMAKNLQKSCEIIVFNSKNTQEKQSIPLINLIDEHDS